MRVTRLTMGGPTELTRHGEANPRAGIRTARRAHIISAALALLACVSAACGQSGIITTAAGPSLRDSNLSSPSLQLPAGVAVSGSGVSATIYTADANNCVVWQTQGGQSIVFAGILATTPGQCSSGAPTTVPTTTPLQYPVSVAFCNTNLFIASNGYDPFVFNSSSNVGGTVYEVDNSGTLSALPLPQSGGAGAGPLHPVSVACDASGNVYVASYYYLTQDSGFFGQVNEFSPTTGGWTVGAPVSGLFDQAYSSLAIDPKGDLFGILEGQVGEGWLGTPLLGTGSIQNITLGTSGVSGGNTFYNPDGLAFDSTGKIYIAEAASIDQYTSYVESVQSGGTKTIIAGNGIPGYSGDGGLAIDAEVDGVDSIAIDSSGYIYLADSENQRIRRIHNVVPGPASLNPSSVTVPQSSGVQFGSLQGVLNPTTGDYYYVAGANTVNVINTGSTYLVPGYERIFASIAVGAAGQPGYPSPITLAVDPVHNVIYASNTADGNLYAIDGSTWTVAGTLALDNPGASLLAVDTGLNEVYAAGPTTSTVSAIRGGLKPELIGNLTGLDDPVSSISVDAATHAVYAVGEGTEGFGGYLEALYTLVPDPGTGVLSQGTIPFPEFEAIYQPNFITNSIAVDPQTGSLLAAGIASIDPVSAQTYDAEDLFQFAPAPSYAPIPYSWPPITVSLDAPNRAFYLTDFDGNLTDPSSNATMITGMDAVSVGGPPLTSTTIPIFGTGATPASPHVYDSEPDISSYQAWISGSDAADGGFVKLWDSTTQKITESVMIGNSGGGHLAIDSANHAAYLLDHVNGVLWLINKPQWTPTPPPTLTQSADGQSVAIAASNIGDVIFYTVDGTPPELSSSSVSCASPCTVNLTQGVSTVVDAMEFDNSTALASNVVQSVFTAPVPTNLVISSVTPNPATTGASITALATLTTTASAVTGTVTFSGVLNGTSSTLCSSAAVTLNNGSWQAACTFVPKVAGSYTLSASFSGDSFNETSTSLPVTLQVNQGTTPILGSIAGNGTALAINSNNATGLAYNAVLNTDSSVSLVQDGALLSGQTCPAFSGLNSATLSAGAVYIDAGNNRIYLAMISGSSLYAAYESIAAGNCTQGPLLQLSNIANSQVALSVDPVENNVYVMNFYGADFDVLYIVNSAPWNPSSLPTPAQMNLDYSAQYGPMVLDPSNHQLYINDLGGSAYGPAGTYATSGFFVYDPTHSATPADNLEHVAGYNSGGTTTGLNAGTLLDTGAGQIVLINENPSYSTANLTVPITILDTTKFSFFTNTTHSNSNGEVDITPGAGLSTISATAQYSAIGGADINAAAGLVYAYAYNPNNSTQPGMLLQYNLSPPVTSPPTSPEMVLTSSLAMPVTYDYSGPWTQLSYDPESTQIALWAAEGTNGSATAALGITSPLCSGSPTLTELVGNEGSPTPLGASVVNFTSGYIYAIQPGGGYPPTNPALYFVTPTPNTCSAAPPSPAAISAVSGGGQSAVIGQTFADPLVVKVTDASNNPFSGATVTFSVPASGASVSLSSFTATTGSDGTASVMATADGIASSSAYTVSAGVSGVTAPATFSLTNTKITPTVNVTASSYALVYGQPVTISAAISPTNVDGSTPSGSVTFYDGATTLTPNEPVSAGAAKYPVTVLAVGSHNTYSAQYLGDSNFQESGQAAAPSAVVIGKAASTLSGPPTQPVSVPSGQAGSIRVTVSGQFSGSGIATPSGSVGYSVTGNAFPAGTAAITAGTAAIPVPANTASGRYTVTVSYAGDGNYNSAPAITIQLTVTGASTTVTQFAFQTPPPATLTAGGNAGTVVVLEENSQGATVTSASDKIEIDVGYIPAPFAATNEYAEHYVVTASGGKATFNLTSDLLTAAGTYTYTAEAPMPVTPATATETVAAAAPARLTIGSGNNQSISIGESFQTPLSVSALDQYGNLATGAVITFTAPNPTGPSAVLSSPTAVVSASSSFASVNAAADGYAGAYTVTASAGTTPGSPSIGFSLTNNKALTQMAFSLSPQTPIVYGQAQTTLAAKLTGAGGTVPTGTVSFSSYSTAIGSAGVNPSGVAQNSLFLTPTENMIAASYPGDSNYVSVTQTANVNFVSQAPTTLSGPSTLPIVTLPGVGTTVPIQVIAPYSGPGIVPPSGSVTYTLALTGSATQPLSGNVPLNSSSAATIPIPSTLSAGSWNLNVAYSGDMNYKYSANVVIPIDVADFSLAASSGSITDVVAYPGQNASWTFTISPVAPATTFPVNINLSVSGLPAGSTYTITPATIQAGSGATPVTLVVTLPPPTEARNQQSPAGPVYAVVALVLLPLARRMRRAAKRMRRAAMIVAIATAVCAVSVSLNGCANGGFFNQPPRNYTITVTGTAGSLSHSLNLGLTVE